MDMRPSSHYYGDINKGYAKGITSITITFAIIFLVLYGLIKGVNGYAEHCENEEWNGYLSGELGYKNYSYEKIKYIGKSFKTAKKEQGADVHEYLVTNLKTPDGDFYKEANVYLEIKEMLTWAITELHSIEPL